VKRLTEDNPRAAATLKLMGELEENCLQDVADMIHNYGRTGPTGSAGVATLFQHIVDLEMNFY